MTDTQFWSILRQLYGHRNATREKGQALRILIADDHIEVRHTLRFILESHAGWEVCSEAEDGVEAVRRALECVPDVIVMDVTMPAMNGLDAARMIIKKLPQSSIVILTQHQSNELARLAMQAGVHGFVTKAEATDELVRAVERASKPNRWGPTC
jgi:DNA-binding NarL/FixJ family response regulator